MKGIDNDAETFFPLIAQKRDWRKRRRKKESPFLPRWSRQWTSPLSEGTTLISQLLACYTHTEYRSIFCGLHGHLDQKLVTDSGRLGTKNIHASKLGEQDP